MVINSYSFLLLFHLLITALTQEIHLIAFNLESVMLQPFASNVRWVLFGQNRIVHDHVAGQIVAAAKEDQDGDESPEHLPVSVALGPVSGHLRLRLVTIFGDTIPVNVDRLTEIAPFMGIVPVVINVAGSATHVRQFGIVSVLSRRDGFVVLDEQPVLFGGRGPFLVRGGKLTGTPILIPGGDGSVTDAAEKSQGRSRDVAPAR